MMVDMYKLANIHEPDMVISSLKKDLNQRPSKCLGIRLLASLDREGSYIVVSYWPDRSSMLAASLELHQRIAKAIQGSGAESAIEAYDIAHEI